MPFQSIGNKLQSSTKKDPLEGAKRNPLGRPKLKRQRREKWKFPRQVSKGTSEALLDLRKQQLEKKAQIFKKDDVLIKMVLFCVHVYHCFRITFLYSQVSY